jgi:hypothetical protein
MAENLASNRKYHWNNNHDIYKYIFIINLFIYIQMLILFLINLVYLYLSYYKKTSFSDGALALQ